MMNKTLEIEEKTIDEAIEKACREFKVPREKLNIEIISQGSSGFWGVLSKKAKIKATLLSFDVSFAMDDHDSYPAPDQAQSSEIKTEKNPAAEESLLSAVSPTAARAKELLEGILRKMTFECRISVQEAPEKIILNIEGEGSSLLIGKHGQNLDAIQYILNKAVNKSDGERKMIMVDSEAYRKKREASLLQLAEKVREKVRKTNKPVSLGNMNAHDRRIIHLALQEDSTLMTKSRGEGEYRKIVILPAKKGPRRNSKEKRHE